MGQLRTANKRHNRAILALRSGEKAIGRELAIPAEPITEIVRS